MATEKTAAKNSRSNETDPARKAIRSFGGYFTGSWQELKLVRWPNRRATWSMTFAVLLFTGLFLIFIVILDALFSQLFNLIIK